MADTWRFSDEWAVRAAAGLPGVTPQAVEQFRGEKKKYLSHALIDAGLVTQERFVKAAETLFRTAYSALYPERVDKFALSLVPEKICRKHGLIPVKVLDAEIKVAMADPADLTAQADVEALTGRRVLPQFCLPREVEACMEQLFSSDTVIFDLLSKVEAPEEILVLGEKNSGDSQDASVTSPVIKLVNSIISQAYRKGSSDIHIEHEEKSSHVRIRVDGELKNVMRLPRHIAVGAVVSRIKIMSDLDVSNHFIPQDGRTKLRIGSAEVGLRVSTLPTSFGEKVVMRILDQRAAEVPFEKLGFAPEVVSGLDKCLTSTQGIILVTGPTGSGKTTTLYSVLNKVKSERTNVVTVEDPIEYKLPGINQVQVNEKQGLSFAAVLRSVLRQDPDIIMVGEIRDAETAQIAVRAALTGHLVLSTLHTNDAVSTLVRLINIGVEPFLVATAVNVAAAQRLVRKICKHCKEAYRPTPEEVSLFAPEPAPEMLYRGRGCKECRNLGYHGRLALYEVFWVTANVRRMVIDGADGDMIRKYALDNGMVPLRQAGFRRAVEGLTTLEEVLAVVADQE